MRQGKIVDEDGTICYYKDDQLHSYNDLPAIERRNGTKYWYQNGKQHRDNDQPAAEHANGDKYWHQNGRSHRLAGPAVISASGIDRYYYIKGEHFTKEEHANHPEVKKYRLQQVLDRVLKE